MLRRAKGVNLAYSCPRPDAWRATAHLADCVPKLTDNIENRVVPEEKARWANATSSLPLKNCERRVSAISYTVLGATYVALLVPLSANKGGSRDGKFLYYYSRCCIATCPLSPLELVTSDISQISTVLFDPAESDARPAISRNAWQPNDHRINPAAHNHRAIGVTRL